MGYSKLHSSLVNSSLWCERDDVRLLFITMLALADYNGDIFGSWGGIARQANIQYPPDEDERDPFVILMEPDADSSDIFRNPENEGRRVEEIAGGFHIINYPFYRGLRNDDDRREQNRQAQSAYRKRNKPKSAKVSQGNPQSAHAEAEAEAEADKEAEEVHPLAPSRGKCPSLKEAVDFLGSDTFGTEFWDYYESNGWRVGRNPMKDWKAAARRWKRQQTTGNNGQQVVRFQDRNKRKEQLQEQLNVQFRNSAKDDAGRAIYTREEKTERDRLYNEMEKLA